MAMVSAACDHVFVMDRGEIISSGTPTEIARDSRVREAYLGAAAPPPRKRAPRRRKAAPALAGAR
jgi:ABC-type glutathione transport system ATPase component